MLLEAWEAPGGPRRSQEAPGGVENHALEAWEATGDVVNHAFGRLQNWQFLWETYRLGAKGDVVNHAFGSLGGHSSFGKLIDWGPQETW